MKILVDQNISFRLIARIAAYFPEAAHVKSLDLMDADDVEIFQFARQQGFDVVLTQDDDFPPTRPATQNHLAPNW